MAQNESAVQLPDREIAFTDTGDTGAAGLPIVVAHGFALDSTMFAGMAEPAPSRRVVAWDAPGHGRSPAAGGPYSFWDLARDQLALMDALGIGRAVVGGVSQGGFTALRTALLAPERVAGLLLIDTEADALSDEDATAYGELFAALEQQGPTPELTGALAAQIVGDHPAASRWARTWSERGVPLGRAVECLVGRDDVTGRLPEISAPALVLRGEHDRSIPPERQEAMRARLGGPSELVVVDGAGHSPPLTHPDQVNALVNEFLARYLPVG